MTKVDGFISQKIAAGVADVVKLTGKVEAADFRGIDVDWHRSPCHRSHRAEPQKLALLRQQQNREECRFKGRKVLPSEVRNFVVVAMKVAGDKPHNSTSREAARSGRRDRKRPVA